MLITICISDYWHSRRYLQITKKSNNYNNNNKYNNEVRCKISPAFPLQQLLLSTQQEKNASLLQCHGKTEHEHNEKENKKTMPDDGRCRSDAFALRRLQQTIDGYSVFYLLREIESFTQFRLQLYNNLIGQNVQLLWLQMEPPVKHVIDYEWNHMLTHALHEKVEVEHLMSWLSTLGGGFSALGEQFGRCAETAGKISLHQLSIGLRLGDPFLQARCKLYYSISLIQTGRLRAAKYIIREQYRFARKEKEIDLRLIKMCKGIWLRLQYEYGLRSTQNRRLQTQTAGAGDN